MLVASLRGGNNTVFHNVVSEAVTLDEGWIDTVEAALFSVEKIIKNPRKFIAEEELLVDVERARHTNAKTVRHLSSNSQYVQNIGPDGEVMPKKLLTTEMKEDLAIYENRFVCSLVLRLIPFVEQRYREIEERVHSADRTHAGLSAKFSLGESQVECTLDVKVREQPHDTVLLEKNKALLERILQLRRRLKVLQNTSFMLQLSAQKPVRPPIQKTNLIRMNVDYRNCYQLWLYISSYSFVGFSVQYEEKNLPVSGDYYDDMTMLCAMSVQSLLRNHLVNREYYDSIPKKAVKEKKYKTATSYTLDASFAQSREKAGDDVVNEYYFKRMRDEVVRATKRGEVTNEKDIQLSFARFFRAIAKINGEMFDDVITSQKDNTTLRRKTAIEKKQNAVKHQQQLLRRYHLLSRLMSEQLEKALNRETRELVKLEKLKEDLEKEQGKVREKKKKAREKKARIARIQAKKKLADERAKQYETDLREKDAQKQAAIEEAKRQKRAEAQRRRDLKRLDALKEKYHDEDN
jgi:hypothetical protein